MPTACMLLLSACLTACRWMWQRHTSAAATPLCSSSGQLWSKRLWRRQPPSRLAPAWHSSLQRMRQRASNAARTAWLTWRRCARRWAAWCGLPPCAGCEFGGGQLRRQLRTPSVLGMNPAHTQVASSLTHLCRVDLAVPPAGTACWSGALSSASLRCCVARQAPARPQSARWLPLSGKPGSTPGTHPQLLAKQFGARLHRAVACSAMACLALPPRFSHFLPLLLGWGMQGPAAAHHQLQPAHGSLRLPGRLPPQQVCSRGHVGQFRAPCNSTWACRKAACAERPSAPYPLGRRC